MARALIVTTVATASFMGNAAIGSPVKIKATGGPGTYQFTPGFPHVKKGRKVKWINTTGTSHTMTFYKGPWKGKDLMLSTGGTKVKKPRKKGEYLYYCRFHASVKDGNCSGSMCGAFHVSRN